MLLNPFVELLQKRLMFLVTIQDMHKSKLFIGQFSTNAGKMAVFHRRVCTTIEQHIKYTHQNAFANNIKHFC